MPNQTANDRLILGIDPGTNLMGWGIIKISRNEATLIDFGDLNLKKEESQYQKLALIYEECCGLIDNYHPCEVSIEAPFQGKNVQSMLKLGRAQGVAIAAAIGKKLPVFEYAPRKIKQSITGNGNASKEQVAAMVQHILKLKELPPNLDVTDGLAAALCHFFQKGAQKKGATKSYGSWSQFIANNADRVKE
ncbi:MAG: crossover junction endodeoxyribonuclease RuvC [Bacteroidetes bacterium]|nr:crossover junction endodeoxyribonuclease RuvC [Bacteroidota bacterium]